MLRLIYGYINQWGQCDPKPPFVMAMRKWLSALYGLLERVQKSSILEKIDALAENMKTSH